MSDELRISSRVDADLIRKFTGRFANLSQFFPELRHPLSAGCWLSNGKWARLKRRGAKGKRWLRLRRGSRCFSDLEALLQVASEVVGDNHGVVMAPALEFDDVGQEGVLTVVTDASRVRIRMMGSADTLSRRRRMARCS